MSTFIYNVNNNLLGNVIENNILAVKRMYGSEIENDFLNNEETTEAIKEMVFEEFKENGTLGLEQLLAEDVITYEDIEQTYDYVVCKFIESICDNYLLSMYHDEEFSLSYVN